MKNKMNRGFTLTEVMIAIAIFGIALIGTAIVFNVGPSSVRKTSEVTMAAQAAQQELEIIRDQPYGSILTMSTTFTTSGFSSLNSPVGTITIDTAFFTTSSTIRRVCVNVSWTASSWGTSTTASKAKVTLCTLITQEGIDKQ